MHRHLLSLLAIPALALAAQPGQQPPPRQALAGWLGIFPTMLGYQRTFTAPVIEGEAKKMVYRQTVKYEWTGGAARLVEVTAARDAAFKQRYSAAEVAKEKQPPASIKVGDYPALLWKFDKPAKEREDWPLAARLVVLLDEDRVLMLEFRGPGPWGGSWESYAEKFDLKKTKSALDQPPRTGDPKTLESFKQLKKGMSYADVMDWVGPAEKDIGSGIHIMQYTLADGSQVMLGFPDFQKMIYAKHRTKDGKAVDLAD
jgi:hypothetical protein